MKISCGDNEPTGKMRHERLSFQRHKHPMDGKHNPADVTGTIEPFAFEKPVRGAAEFALTFRDETEISQHPVLRRVSVPIAR